MKKQEHITAFYVETLLLILVFIAIILVLTHVFGLGKVQSSRAKLLTTRCAWRKMRRKPWPPLTARRLSFACWTRAAMFASWTAAWWKQITIPGWSLR